MKYANDLPKGTRIKVKSISEKDGWYDSRKEIIGRPLILKKDGLFHREDDDSVEYYFFDIEYTVLKKKKQTA